MKKMKCFIILFLLLIVIKSKNLKIKSDTKPNLVKDYQEITRARRIQSKNLQKVGQNKVNLKQNLEIHNSNISNFTDSNNTFILKTDKNNPVVTHVLGDVTYTIISGPKVTYSYIPKNSWINDKGQLINGDSLIYSSVAPIIFTNRLDSRNSYSKFKTVFDEIKKLKLEIFGDKNYDMTEFRDNGTKFKIKKILQLEELLSFYFLNKK